MVFSRSQKRTIGQDEVTAPFCSNLLKSLASSYDPGINGARFILLLLFDRSEVSSWEHDAPRSLFASNTRHCTAAVPWYAWLTCFADIVSAFTFALCLLLYPPVHVIPSTMFGSIFRDACSLRSGCMSSSPDPCFARYSLRILHSTLLANVQFKVDDNVDGTLASLRKHSLTT